MADLTTALLAAALSLPSPWYPPGKAVETRAEYEARVATIAEAVATEVAEVRLRGLGARDLAFAVMTLMYNESRFALDVHSGERLGDRGRASCLAQIHKSGLVPRDEWEVLTGVDLESTRRCARAAIRLLGAQYRRCAAGSPSTRQAIARAFAAYASGSSCVPTSSSLKRAEEVDDLKARALRRTRAARPAPVPAASSGASSRAGARGGSARGLPQG
jgi:hypothetical protein